MRFETILKLTQEELFKRLLDIYKDKAIYQKGSYVLVKGKAPVMLVAHMDTVHLDPFLPGRQHHVQPVIDHEGDVIGLSG